MVPLPLCACYMQLKLLLIIRRWKWANQRLWNTIKKNLWRLSQQGRVCPIQTICSNLDTDFSRPSQNRDSGCVGPYQQTEIATRVNKELSLTPGLSDPEAHGLAHCCSREKSNIVLNIRYQSINWSTAAPCLKTINNSDKHCILTLLSKIKRSVLNCYSF